MQARPLAREYNSRMKRRVLLLALLVYVALDLSLPAMPGAFVFDVAGSVEGAQRGRPRFVIHPVVMPAMLGPTSVLLEPRVEATRPSAGPVVWLVRWAGRCLPRAAGAPPPLSEDPH